MFENQGNGEVNPEFIIDDENGFSSMPL